MCNTLVSISKIFCLYIKLQLNAKVTKIKDIVSSGEMKMMQLFLQPESSFGVVNPLSLRSIQIHGRWSCILLKAKAMITSTLLLKG